MSGMDPRESGAEKPRAELEQRIRELEEQSGIDRAMIAYLHDEVAAEQLTAEHLHAALSTARRIGAAIGIVMANRKLTEKAAFEFIGRLSQERNRKLRDLADDIILTGSAVSPGRPGPH